MPCCAAFGCSNRSSRPRKSARQNIREGAPKVTFHKFPKHPERRNAWVEAVQRVGWIPNNNSVLCSLHFTEEAFDRTSLSCVRIRETAVPSIFSALQDDNEDIRSTSPSEISDPLEIENTTNVDPLASTSSAVPDIPPPSSLPAMTSTTFTPESVISDPLENINTTDVDPLLSTSSAQPDIPPPPSSSPAVTSVTFPPEIRSISRTTSDSPPAMTSINIPSEMGTISITTSESQPAPTSITFPPEIRSISITALGSQSHQIHRSIPSAQIKLMQKYKLMKLRYQKKIKLLQQSERRHVKRIESLKNILATLKSKNLIDNEHVNILKNIPRLNAENLKTQVAKTKGYSPARHI